MKHTKAQAEIMGLMIIVIIITISMLFYVSYATNDSQSSTKNDLQKEFIDNELSASYIQTLIRTTVPDCGDASIEDLIIFCGLDKSPSTCLGINPCTLLDDTIRKIAENTLNVWQKSYSLKVDFGASSLQEDLLIEPEKDTCGEGTVGRRSPGFQPIPYPSWDKAFLSLAICKQ